VHFSLVIEPSTIHTLE